MVWRRFNHPHHLSGNNSGQLGFKKEAETTLKSACGGNGSGLKQTVKILVRIRVRKLNNSSIVGSSIFDSRVYILLLSRPGFIKGKNMNIVGNLSDRRQ